MLSWDNEIEFNRWRNAISECGLSLTRGVPVWEKFYQNLWAPHSLEHAHQSIADTGMGHLSVGVEACAIDEMSRYSFYLAFGIFPDAQDAIERGMPQVGWRPPCPGEKILPNLDLQNNAKTPIKEISSESPFGEHHPYAW